MHAETLGFGTCPSCAGQVAWKENKSKFAYCRCDHCGAETRHHWHKSSDKVKAQFSSSAKPQPVEKEAPAPATQKPASTLLG